MKQTAAETEERGEAEDLPSSAIHLLPPHFLALASDEFVRRLGFEAGLRTSAGGRFSTVSLGIVDRVRTPN